MAQKAHIHQLPKEQVVMIIPKTLYNSNKTYKDIIKPIDVRAPLPETFGFGTANEVNQIFDFLKFKSQAIQIASGGLIHASYDRGISERSFWRSIENQEITVELEFNAYYSGKIDVVDPVQDLMLLAAPVESVGTTELGFGWDAPPLVTIRFGKLLYFTNVIIKSVNAVFSNKLDNEFDPMSATVSMTFIPSDPIGYAGIRGYEASKSGFAIKVGKTTGRG